jgi:Putative Zn-dependent protease, contains TPR repeats
MKNFNELLKKGFEFQKNNNFKEALKIYNELIVQDEKNSQLLLFLGTLHLQINKNEQAKNYLELSLDIDKNNIIATNNLALVYEKLEKKDKAINLFKRSIEISPNNPETFFRIANLYSSEKKYELQ